MQLVGILEIKSYEKIKEFLNDEHVGRMSSIDVNGFPQIIPMNFVFQSDAVYMHSHVKGEKLDNIYKNNKVGLRLIGNWNFYLLILRILIMPLWLILCTLVS